MWLHWWGFVVQWAVIISSSIMSRVTLPPTHGPSLICYHDPSVIDAQLWPTICIGANHLLINGSSWLIVSHSSFSPWPTLLLVLSYLFIITTQICSYPLCHPLICTWLPCLYIYQRILTCHSLVFVNSGFSLNLTSLIPETCVNPNTLLVPPALFLSFFSYLVIGPLTPWSNMSGEPRYLPRVKTYVTPQQTAWSCIVEFDCAGLGGRSALTVNMDHKMCRLCVALKRTHLENFCPDPQAIGVLDECCVSRILTNKVKHVYCT